VVDVAGVQSDLERGGALGAGLVDRVGLLAVIAGGPVEEARDRRPDELDVADLFGPDRLDQVG